MEISKIIYIGVQALKCDWLLFNLPYILVITGPQNTLENKLPNSMKLTRKKAPALGEHLSQSVRIGTSFT